MDKLATVVYYTSNREDENFENKIRKRILKTIGDLPLISVSQKPIKGFGKNICVGDVGLSVQNVHRQLQIGAEAATTPFIISAEADCLYPKEYFEFVPSELNQCYRYDNIYILWKYYTKHRKPFWRKKHTEGAQICGREFLIGRIKKRLDNRGMWNTVLEHKKSVPNIYRKNYKFFGGEIPVISIKTDEGLHPNTGLMGKSMNVLPYWGEAELLRKKMFNN